MAVLWIGLFVLVPGKALALSFDEALSRAERAPEILASLAEEEAAAELTKAAGQLPDPRLVLSVDDLMLEGEARYRFDASKRMIGVMQEVPAASRRAAERQMAAASREAAGRSREAVRLAARREISLLWLQLYFLTQRETLLRARAEEIQRRQEAATALLAGGGSAEMAMTALYDRQAQDDALDQLQRDLRLVRARLARWIGPLSPAEIATGDLPDWARDAPAAPPAFSEATATAAEAVVDADATTELRASRARLAETQAQWRLALAEKDPDWSVEVGLGQDTMGNAMMMAKIGVSLPLFSRSRQDPRIAAARSRLVAAEAGHALRQAEFVRQQEELLAEETARGALLRRLAEETLPLLEQGVALAEAAYSGGGGSAVALILAREKRLDARLRALDLETERAALRARLYFLRQRGEQGETHHE
jgi:outer membrane protein TolC